MRVLTITGLILAGAAGVAAGQQALQVEVGGFGTFTRYDRAMGIENGFGGGARLGFFLTSRWSIEVEGGYQLSGTKAWVPWSQLDVSMQVASASLLYNIPAGGHTYYLGGGYSRLVFGKNPPYDFIDNGVHGEIGDRIFLSDRLALRLEVRAHYAPKSGHINAPWGGQVVGSAGVSYFATSPTERARQYRAQAGDRHYQWYWGGQGGAFLYKTNLQPLFYDPLVGGHWLITARKTSLYVAYEQAWFLTEAIAAIEDRESSNSSLGPGYRDVTFSDMRRIMFGVVAHPAEKPIEPFVGAGFAMMQVLNPVVDCSACQSQAEQVAAQEKAELAASKAFFWLMGGMQINYSPKLNLFGHYIMTSQARDFLLTGNTHTVQAGVRYSLGTSKEGITERH